MEAKGQEQDTLLNLYARICAAENELRILAGEIGHEIYVRAAPTPYGGPASHSWWQPDYFHQIYSDGTEAVTYKGAPVKPERIRFGEEPERPPDPFGTLERQRKKSI